MPKPQRTEEEVQAVREDILKNALALLNRDGFAGFSMRKLASRQGVAAKTLYNYFYNQDELYLHILIWGFDRLHAELVHSLKGPRSPMKKLEAAVRAYVDFGLENPELYNLMFTLHVPKFNDYLDTPMEPVAREELHAALKNADFFMSLIRQCLIRVAGLRENEISDPEIRTEMILAWTRMHGYVAGINNTLLDYMHESPLSLREGLVRRIMRDIGRELEERAGAGPATLKTLRN